MSAPNVAGFTTSEVVRTDTFVIHALADAAGLIVARCITDLRWDCPMSGRPSFHPLDVAERYCAGCHRFHVREEPNV